MARANPTRVRAGDLASVVIAVVPEVRCSMKAQRARQRRQGESSADPKNVSQQAYRGLRKWTLWEMTTGAWRSQIASESCCKEQSARKSRRTS
jgi:uncharacterized cupin superfamily protein